MTFYSLCNLSSYRPRKPRFSWHLSVLQRDVTTVRHIWELSTIPRECCFLGHYDVFAALRRVSTNIGQCTWPAQVSAKTLRLTELALKSDVTSLLRGVDETFGLNTATLYHDNAPVFLDYNWNKNTAAKKYFVTTHSLLDKNTKLDMNNELKRHRLLKQETLNSHDCSLEVGAAGGPYSH